MLVLCSSLSLLLSPLATGWGDSVDWNSLVTYGICVTRRVSSKWRVAVLLFLLVWGPFHFVDLCCDLLPLFQCWNVCMFLRIG